jgi:hypothetical protein
MLMGLPEKTGHRVKLITDNKINEVKYGTKTKV